MSELRKDPVIGRWVIIASERAKRPTDFFVEAPKPPSPGFCPFCPGNEDKTPKELLAYQYPIESNPDSRWWLRVVPNKFPALVKAGDLEKSRDGIFEKLSGIGAHEVIIETPDHQSSMADFDLAQIEEVLKAYKERILDLKKDERFQYIMIFKNHGKQAGASLDHSHSQLIALPIVPKRVNEEIEGSLRYHRIHNRCVYCDMIQQEKASDLRIVHENKTFVCLNPYASRFPFEMWILPKAHQSHFEKTPSETIAGFAEILSHSLKRIKTVLSNPSYNYMLHTGPCGEAGDYPHYHWHLEITPKLTQVAGFEWGTGFYINPMPPEKAAEYLRNGVETRQELDAAILPFSV